MYEKKKQYLKESLEETKKAGVNLFLEGRPASPATIARKCVCEDLIYMADYVLDDTGVLKEVRYDKVTKWK